jgi:hypothetical protein
LPAIRVPESAHDDVAVDPSGKLHVASAANRIAIYAAGTTGDVAPVAMIKGGQMGLDAPRHLARFCRASRLAVTSDNSVLILQNARATLPRRTVRRRWSGSNIRSGLKRGRRQQQPIPSTILLASMRCLGRPGPSLEPARSSGASLRSRSWRSASRGSTWACTTPRYPQSPRPRRRRAARARGGARRDRRRA